MIIIPKLQAYAEQYKTLPMRPLKITADFANPPAGYDYPHLDNILSKAVVWDVTGGKGLAPSSEPYFLPIPCVQAWVSDSGLPLWRTTDFLPQGQNEKEAAYWHKRKIHPHFVKRTKGKPINIRGTEGADKEYRIPLPRNTAIEWVAYCDGNMEEIGRLLTLFHAIGKKTTQGHGALLSFRLEPIAEFSFFQQEKMLRPLPLGIFNFVGDAYLQGWTPPYWLPSTQLQSVPTMGKIKEMDNNVMQLTGKGGAKFPVDC
jgi:CRISPR type IV-associated protein Csf3